MTIDQSLHDLQPKQILRQANSDGNTFNNDSMGKGRPFLAKKWKSENLLKNIDEQRLNICIQTNCITFLSFKVG